MSQFMGEKKYNKNIAQINPFSPPECSSRRVKLLFIKADTWLANIDGLLFFFYHSHIYHMHIIQRTWRVGISKKKRAHKHGKSRDVTRASSWFESWCP